MLFVRCLIWDSWNVAHIARHDVSSDEVEEVCHGDHIIREGHTGRIMLIGPTKGKRMLAIILEDMGGDVYYVVTARPADRKERRLYQEES
jgi:uncharacterized protein